MLISEIGICVFSRGSFGSMFGFFKRFKEKAFVVR